MGKYFFCMKKIIFISYLLFGFLDAFSQGEINQEVKVFYRNESSFSFQLSSNGFGSDYMFAKDVNAKTKKDFKFKLIILKDPKELQLTNIYYSNNKSFVFGKLNAFWAGEFLYGKQKEAFSKKDAGSVSIRYFYHAGVSIGFLKPIYYQVVEAISPDYSIIYTQKFDDNIHGPEDIFSRESFFVGMNEISVNPGITAELGFNFEFGKNDRAINSIDIGISFNAFLLNVPLMADDNHQQIFISLFASYRFGSVINPILK